jgi:hypothetical protein
MVKLPAEPTARFERIAEEDAGADNTLLVTDSFTGCVLAPVRSPEHAAIVLTKTAPASSLIFGKKRAVIDPPLS